MINWLVIAWVLLPFFAWNSFVFTLRFNVSIVRLNLQEMLFLIFCWIMTAVCLGVIL